jgi:hypothetical protein
VKNAGSPLGGFAIRNAVALRIAKPHSGGAAALPVDAIRISDPVKRELQRQLP